MIQLEIGHFLVEHHPGQVKIQLEKQHTVFPRERWILPHPDYLEFFEMLALRNELFVEIQ